VVQKKKKKKKKKKKRKKKKRKTKKCQVNKIVIRTHQQQMNLGADALQCGRTRNRSLEEEFKRHPWHS